VSMGDAVRAITVPDAQAALMAALEGTIDGVVVLDPLGRISFVNQALLDAWGVPDATAVGRLLEEFVQVTGDQSNLAQVLTTAGARGWWRGELCRRGADPGRGFWDVTLTVVDGAALGSRHAAGGPLVGIFRDVSEKRALEQQRADLLSMITHDIKAPLTVILGYTELLGDADPPPAGTVLLETLSRIRESGEQIHLLVSNFLELSRIEAGRLFLDRRPLDLADLVAHVVDQYSARARRKGVSVALTQGSLPSVTADGPQIERVVVNLLANAIKYTPSGGGIAVTTSREEDRVAIAVRDTGPGIAAEEMPHIFEKYRRARDARRVEGTGLGLFIAKTIIEAHGGAIRVESTPGVGSVFTVLLPAA
jgi:signal transduction histidine kinase